MDNLTPMPELTPRQYLLLLALLVLVSSCEPVLSWLFPFLAGSVWLTLLPPMIGLYQLLQKLGAKPVLVCGDPLYSALKADYQCYQITVNQYEALPAIASKALAELQPQLVISIERPGFNAQQRYANMRGEDISARCASFDYFLTQAPCPTIGIGDGGNEIGMGNLLQAVSALNITPAVTECDELIVADVSNWAAWGLAAMVSLLRNENLLAGANPLAILQYLSAKGSVDGVTRLNTLTEDGLAHTEGQQLINDLGFLIS